MRSRLVVTNSTGWAHRRFSVNPADILMSITASRPALRYLRDRSKVCFLCANAKCVAMALLNGAARMILRKTVHHPKSAIRNSAPLL